MSKNSRTNTYQSISPTLLVKHMEENAAGWLASSLIDTLKCEVTVKHAPIEELVRRSTNWSPGKPGRWRVKSDLYGVSADVQSVAGGTKLYVEASAIKFLTGQNLWGGEEVKALAVMFVLEVLERAGIDPSHEEAKAIQSGEFRLLRVDIAVHCTCRDANRASWLMKALFQRAGGVAKELSRVKGYETIYLGQHSKWCTLRMYRKDIELRKHPPAEGAFRRDEIRALDVGVIRFELVLRNGYLKAHGLQHPKAWTSRKVRMLIAAKISNLVPGDGHVPTLPERAQYLTAGQWMKLRLWALEDVAALGSPSTYERDRRAIRSATGFDVASHVCADDQRRIYRPVREELLRGLAFRCHWSEWTVHGEALTDYLATKRMKRPIEKSLPDVLLGEQVAEPLRY